MWYDPHDVILAWDAFVAGALTEPALSNASNFRHDMIDLTRQSMQEIFHLLYSKLLIVYWKKDAIALGYITFFIFNFISHALRYYTNPTERLLAK